LSSVEDRLLPDLRVARSPYRGMTCSSEPARRLRYPVWGAPRTDGGYLSLGPRTPRRSGITPSDCHRPILIALPTVGPSAARSAAGHQPRKPRGTRKRQRAPEWSGGLGISMGLDLGGHLKQILPWKPADVAASEFHEAVSFARDRLNCFWGKSLNPFDPQSIPPKRFTLQGPTS
jgi:hypothetical protein